MLVLKGVVQSSHFTRENRGWDWAGWALSVRLSVLDAWKTHILNFFLPSYVPSLYPECSLFLCLCLSLLPPQRGQPHPFLSWAGLGHHTHTCTQANPTCAVLWDAGLRGTVVAVHVFGNSEMLRVWWFACICGSCWVVFRHLERHTVHSHQKRSAKANGTHGLTLKSHCWCCFLNRKRFKHRNLECFKVEVSLSISSSFKVQFSEENMCRVCVSEGADHQNDPWDSFWKSICIFEWPEAED